MDIRNWGLDQIMMLPDHCFGRRWPIALTVIGAAISPRFDIAEMALPEKCVVWELAAVYHVVADAFSEFELRLGDAVPATWALFQGLELLFKGVRTLATADSLIYLTNRVAVHWSNLKMPVEASGRRLIIGVQNGISVNFETQVELTISSIPREVPDCLLSV